MFGIATAGGTLAYQRLAAPFAMDANDYVCQWDSSGDYDAAPKLETITAAVFAISSADDERNPPQSGLMDAAMGRVGNGRLFLIPESDRTVGHLTTAFATWYAKPLSEWLATVPRRGATQ